MELTVRDRKTQQDSIQKSWCRPLKGTHDSFANLPSTHVLGYLDAAAARLENRQTPKAKIVNAKPKA
jgi:hypothetical protein